MDSTDTTTLEALSRKIRLKNLMDKGIQIESEMTDKSAVETLREIRHIITASDDIIAEGSVKDRAENTTEVVLDAQLLKMNHELVSKVLQQTSDFNDKLYQNALNSIVFKDDIANWTALSEIAISVARTCSIQSSMLGAVELRPTIKVAKERQRRHRSELGTEKRPETINQMQRQDKGAAKVNIIHEQVAKIFKANNRQPIPYFKLIIDPNNFMNTVQNSFQMAFLARDNIIAIETGEDNYPHVRLANSEERKAEKDTTQSICTLNMNLCREMILLYDIKEAMLKFPDDAEEDLTAEEEDIEMLSDDD